MKRRITIAVLVQVAIMGLVLAPPLWVRATGTTVYLETRRVDPRALFRGDYVILNYKVAQEVMPRGSALWRSWRSKRPGPVYVTVTTERPARFVSASFDTPRVAKGEACLVGRVRRGSSVDFPQIAQFFVPEGTGRAIERTHGKDLLAHVKVSKGCNAVLMGLEPRTPVTAPPDDGV